MGNLNPYTWVSPAATSGTMGMIFNSLTQWLLDPQFPYGISLGDAPDQTSSVPSDANTYPLAMTVGTFTSTAAVEQPVVHNVNFGTCYMAQAWSSAAAGLTHSPVPVIFVDGGAIWVNTSGVPAGTGCHYSMLFTSDLTNRGW
jgi:hypothetical protein